MNATLTFSFALPEEHYNFQSQVKAQDAQYAISAALETIRSRLKHAPEITDTERRNLEEIRALLAQVCASE